MPYGSKLFLVNSCLSRMPLIFCTLSNSPSGSFRLLNLKLVISWDNIGDHHRYHLDNWDLVCQRKDFEDLGVYDIRDFNLCLHLLGLANYSIPVYRGSVVS